MHFIVSPSQALGRFVHGLTAKQQLMPHFCIPLMTVLFCVRGIRFEHRMECNASEGFLPIETLSS